MDFLLSGLQPNNKTTKYKLVISSDMFLKYKLKNIPNIINGMIKITEIKKLILSADIFAKFRNKRQYKIRPPSRLFIGSKLNILIQRLTAAK